MCICFTVKLCHININTNLIIVNIYENAFEINVALLALIFNIL